MEQDMNLEEFTRKYSGAENLSHVSWRDFPPELQRACERFVEEWFDNTDINDSKEFSGFNDMSVDDLLKYAKGELDEGDRPLGIPFK
jgi:hypothetical protein